MIELLRTWLTAITCSAMVVAMAETLMPKGPVQKIGRLTGGVLLLLTILQPMMRWKDVNFGDLLGEYQVEVQGYSSQLEAVNQDLMKEIIEEETGAYIVDKAEEIGLVCIAVVEVATGEEGIPVPWSVKITGKFTEDQHRILTESIASELDIPEERQSYLWEEVK